MAVKPSEVVRDFSIVDDYEAKIDEALLGARVKNPNNPVVFVCATSLPDYLDREELNKRYRAAGWKGGVSFKSTGATVEVTLLKQEPSSHWHD